MDFDITLTVFSSSLSMKNALPPASQMWYVTHFISRRVLLMAGCYLQVIVPRASAVLDSPGETSRSIHADHISICKYPSSDSPEYKVAATNISRLIRIINLVSFPNSPEAFDALALLLYGDELEVRQARSAVLEKARREVGSIVGHDHVHLEELAKGKAGIWWREELVKRLNLPADMRTLFKL